MKLQGQGPLVATILAIATITILCLSSASMAIPSSQAPTAAPPSLRALSSSAKLAVASEAGPHPGTLDVYEDQGGGSTEDPAAAYGAVDPEPIFNVYESLIAYNGSSTSLLPSGFVPQAATCVPGSQECDVQFGAGNNLVYPNLTTGAPQYYTFELDGKARFYDPFTGSSWPVYPSDVVFSFARTLAFADLPGYGVYNGWINGQALLPGGNQSWDDGMHYPLNNTPFHILSAFLVNDSAYCPAPVVANLATNGCVTFDVGPSGLPWPYFLELVSDQLGGSITPCGKFTYLGAGVPTFYGTSAVDGDGPCMLPGNTTSTTQPAFQQYLSTVSPYAWDAFENLSYNYPSPQPSVQWTMIGSGPYYSPVTNGHENIDPTVGYFLKANPAYQAPEGCAGAPGCLPLPGHYESTVNVYWENSDQTGLQEMIAGQADYVEVDPSDFSTVLQLVNKGTYAMETGLPTLDIFLYCFDLNFSVAAESGIDSTGQLNVPGDFFSNIAVRQFIVNAMPYTTAERAIWTTPSGIQLGENYGGVIPRGLENYYPNNVSWPNGNPTANPSEVGNVSWWWDQAITPGSPWYDPEAAACTSAHPCMFPILSVVGTPSLDDEALLLAGSIKTLSSGALQPYLLDISGNTLGNSLGNPPGSGNMPFYPYLWGPDYPDPTDYVYGMLGANTGYTYPDAVTAQLSLPQYNDSSSSACGPYADDPSSWAALTFWANIGQIPNKCQGIAYWTMVDWERVAGPLTNLTQRELDFNLIEHIANELAVYLYYSQAVNAEIYGSWINATGINTNPMFGGDNFQLWAFWSSTTNTPSQAVGSGKTLSFLGLSATGVYGLLGLGATAAILVVVVWVRIRRRDKSPRQTESPVSGPETGNLKGRVP